MKSTIARRVSPSRLSLASLGTFLIAFTLIFSVAVRAQQNSRNNDYKPDRALKSNARVNPMTLAMELSIPIGGYQGRAGNELPVVLDYSSKVWQVDFLYSWQTQAGDIKTDNRPRYSKTSSAGWTSSLGVPRINYPHNLYRELGQPYNPDECLTNCGSENYLVYYIKRVEVVMPDGSTHEFRKDDTVHLWGSAQGNGTADMTGNFLSVDGTRMRLEISQNQQTLFMPDGSRYLFGQGNAATTLIDRHGNKMIYDPTTKRWTDTVARVIEDPVPLSLDDIAQTQIIVGDKVASFPGKDGGIYNVTLSWRYLKDPNGGESGLTDTTQDLAYLSDQGCQGNLNRWLSTTQNPQPHLFKTGTLYTWDHYTRVCHPIGWIGLDWWPGPRFNPKVLTKITLPNGQKYEFKYNIYGEIEKIIYPTGAYERFLYGEVPAVLPSTSGAYDQANRGVLKRWVSEKGDGSDELPWTYSGWDVTAPDGTKTQQFFVTDSPYNDQPFGFGNPYLGRSYEDRFYNASNQLVRRKLTGYETNGPPPSPNNGAPFRDTRPNKEISILFEPGAAQALATMTETVYDTHPDLEYFAQLNPKQTKTHKYIVLDLATAQTETVATIAAMFSNSTLATITEMDYLYDANYKARNITGLVTETRLKDAGGNIKAKNQIAYDEAAYPLLTDVASVWWEDPNSNYRGLVTTTKSWSDIANNLSVETHAQYDRLGNLRKSWDAKGNLSQIEYSSTYDHAYPTKTISPIPGGNGSTTAFETTVVYDFNTGLPTSSIDANGLETRMEYNDPLLRPTRVSSYYNNQPVGAISETSYGTGTSASTRFVKVRTQIDETKWKEGFSWYDGLGRTIKSQSIDSNGDVFSETLFDNVGRVWKTSNPYRLNETPVWTQNVYDEASRVKEIITPDGAKVQTAYGLATTGSQIGTVVTVTDQASKQRRSVTNALGQLTRVDEPNDAGQLGAIDTPNQPTLYAYDTLNNLTTVNQGVQTRSFAYNSLSRLLSATNPESGLIQYAYDNNGNLTQKTDARLVVTNYVYDALNRVTQRNYTAPGGLPNYQATPNVSYFYDNLPNAKGKLTKVSSSVSTTEYTAFDILGRAASHKQTTDGNIYTTGYNYNLSGALIEETYPSGRVVKNVLDNDGDLAQVQSKKNAGDFFRNYAGSFVYTAAGAVSSLKLGNGKFENTQFNSRLQPTQIGLGASASTQNLLKLNFDYGTTDNNGNVKSQQITVPTVGTNQGFTATQTYTYDPLNRIKQATETIPNQTGWQQTFQYDRFGNRRFDTANNATTTLAPNCQVAVCNPTIDPANNRLIGYVFDNSGNTKTDANGQTFTYDAENKQVQVNDANGIVGQYFYNGDGQRVKKVVPNTGETTVFVYDASNKLVAEYSTVVASPAEAKISYLTNDHLGSPRITTDALGQVISRRDFMPFGEEITRANYGTDNIREKFATYERDDETDLDFAINRYHSSRLGRFTSVDPYNIIFEKEKGKKGEEIARILDKYLADAQNWNRYAYVVNNPLRYSDPDGRRPQTTQETKDLDFLRNLANNSNDADFKSAVLDAVKGIEDAIAASKNKASDPRGLKIALWAVNRAAEPDTSRFAKATGTATFTTNDGQTATIGPGYWKCNLFSAAAQVLGGGVTLGGGGVPVTSRYRGLGAITGDVNLPTANDWASQSDDKLGGYERMANVQMGDVVAWANPNGLGHTGISLGGNVVVYAGEFNVKVNTIEGTRTSLGASTTQFRRKRE